MKHPRASRACDGLLVAAFLAAVAFPENVYAQDFTGTAGFTSAATAVDFGPVPQSPALVEADTITGAATMTLPFQLIMARGNVQPQLALHYRSTDGDGDAGLGWSFGLPVIERRPLSGLPDGCGDPSEAASTSCGNGPAAVTANTDRFVYLGQPLVPLCTVGVRGAGTSSCPQAETMPPWATKGWSYFRLEYDAPGARFFWSPNGKTWRIEFKTGETMELGAATVGPLVSSTSNPSIDVDPGHSIFRWNLVGRWDSQPLAANGSPNNLIIYQWQQNSFGGSTTSSIGYLTDVFDTPLPTLVDSTSFAHHVHLSWALPSYNFVTVANPAVEYAVRQYRLSTVEMSSYPFSGVGTRNVVRRYHLGYLQQLHHSLLTSFQLEGACGLVEGNPASACPPQDWMPPTTMGYLPPIALPSSPVFFPENISGGPSAGQLPFTILGLPSAVQLSLLDIDGDGKADLLENQVGNAFATQFFMPTAIDLSTGGWSTTPVPITIAPLTQGDAPTPSTLLGPAGSFPPSYTLIGDFSGTSVTEALLGSQPTQLLGAVSLGAQVLFSNTAPGSNCYALDIPPFDDLSPGGTTAQWQLVNTPAPCQGPAQGPGTLVGDINGDGLLDFTLPTGGTSLSFRSVDGTIQLFGAASSGPPANSFPVADPLFLVDMNGDGLADYAAIDLPTTANGGTYTVHYAPSGNPLTGNSPFGQYRTMQAILNADGIGGSLGPWLHDLNGDGLADFINYVDNSFNVVWNLDGTNFDLAPGHVTVFPLQSTFIDPPVQVLFGDVNGSGVDDLVWTDGAHVAFVDFQYLLGNPIGRPGILGSVDNGLGVSTAVTYLTSPNIAGSPPKPINVVQRITTQSTEVALGAARSWTEDYVFSGALYDGWAHRVTGFQDVIVRATNNSLAAATNHTTRETQYGWTQCGAQAGCSPASVDTAGTRVFPPLPVVIDDYGDAFGPGSAPPVARTTPGLVHRSTTAMNWQANPIYHGVAGRSTWVVYPSQVDSYLYDTSATPGTQGVVSPTGVLTIAPGDASTPAGSLGIASSLTSGSKSTKHLSRSQIVDPNGNVMSLADTGVAGTDQAITWSAHYVIANGDWAWRMMDETTMPFAQSGVDPPLYPRKISYQYDSFGNLKAAQHVYASPLAALARASGLSPTAPQPLSASTIGSTLTLASFMYDGYGNVDQISRPNNNAGSATERCRQVVYDPAFFQLPTSIEDFSGGCGLGDVLTKILTYDRGFSEVTTENDPSGAESALSYDPFGRLLTVSEPDPALGTVSESFSATHVYHDVPYFALRETITTPAGQLQIYGDGTGQALLTLRTADPSEGDGGPWIASGWRDLTHADQSITTYDPMFYSGSPTAYPWGQKSATSTQVTLDPFGRPTAGTARDGSAAFEVFYHALSKDFWDPGNLDKTSTPSHYAQFSTMTIDGHGRIQSLQKLGNQDTVVTTFSHLATGEVSRIQRAHTANASDSYQRWMAYDSLGRMVMNAEPNASLNFSPSANGATFPMWQYAYDDAGDLVGTSDPRHCGENLYYDGVGRLLAEDYLPCTSTQPAYTPEFEAQYVYDVPDRGEVAANEGPNPNFLMGQLSAVYDRGAHTQFGYDGRGRLVTQARQVAGPAASAGNTVYADSWNVITSAYDAADRLMSQTTGADVPNLMVNGASSVTFGYSQRGLLTSLGSSYGSLLTAYHADALGRPTIMFFGDAAATFESYGYDARGRTANVAIQLGTAPAAPSLWSKRTSTYTPPLTPPPTTFENLTIGYDTANNATSFTDNRPTIGWPAGAEPRSKAATYDDSYQLKTVTVKSVRDLWVSPFQAEATAGDASPVPALTSDTQRYLSQTFSYDYLGNMTSFNDDQSALYDRSLAGSIAYGTPQTSQMTSADGLKLRAAYDAAGELTGLTIARPGKCAPPSNACNQFFSYAWDELGRLASASRWDLTTTPPAPTSPPSSLASQQAAYLYSGSQRVVHLNSAPATGESDYTVEIFPSLRLNHTQPTSSGTDYDRTSSSEAAYLAGLGRLVYDPSLPSPSGNALHVFLELADGLGSTDIVLDRETSEPVEHRTDQAFGAQDADARSFDAKNPLRWQAFREDYRFTGKEDETAFGLSYFGERYYAPNLARWISPDPKTIHGVAGDLNPYAYAENSPLMNVDPNGEGGGDDGSGEGAGAGEGAGGEGAGGEGAGGEGAGGEGAGGEGAGGEGSGGPSPVLAGVIGSQGGTQSNGSANAGGSSEGVGVSFDGDTESSLGNQGSTSGSQTPARTFGNPAATALALEGAAKRDVLISFAQGTLNFVDLLYSSTMVRCLLSGAGSASPAKVTAEALEDLKAPEQVRATTEYKGLYYPIVVLPVVLDGAEMLAARAEGALAGAAAAEGGASVGAMVADEAFLNWSPTSTPTWGHTFLTHGEAEASSLAGRAAGTGQAQGAWLDNEAAAQFLSGQRPYIQGPTSVRLPEGLGQVIRPDGSIVPATRATLIPKPGGGFRTAFPIE